MTATTIEQRSDLPVISFVIPCYRSENTVSSVIADIKRVVAQREEYSYEIICVVDGSPDNVFEVLKSLASRDEHLKVISFAKNAGKHSALLAGFSIVSGNYIVAVDDDGECPISELWSLITPLENGYDIAMARYGHRPVSMIKELEHSVNAFMVRKLIGKPKDIEFSNFSARKRFVCDYLVKYSGPYPYLEGETLAITRNIAMVDLPACKRISGSSGFTFRRGLSLFLNGCTTYSILPLRLPYYLFLICLVFSIGSLFAWFISSSFILLSLMLFIFTLLFLSIGLLGEYVGRLYMVANHLPQYVIRETVNCDEEVL